MVWTSQGVDHHENLLSHECGCQRHYLYSHSSSSTDSDGYDINTGLGSWAQPMAVMVQKVGP